MKKLIVNADDFGITKNVFQIRLLILLKLAI